MANTSDKRIHWQNQRSIYFLRIGFLLINTVYLGLSTIKRTFLSDLHWYLLTSIAALWAMYHLNSMAKGTFDQRGKLISSGLDVNGKGVGEYLFDVIYVTWFVHAGVAIFSRKFWFVYLLVIFHFFIFRFLHFYASK